MQKYFAHTDSVKTKSKEFDFFVELYLASEADAELNTMNLAVGYFHEENDRFITRIAELEKALRWHVGVQHDRYCDINEGKSNCDCGHNLVRPSP